MVSLLTSLSFLPSFISLSLQLSLSLCLSLFLSIYESLSHSLFFSLSLFRYFFISLSVFFPCFCFREHKRDVLILLSKFETRTGTFKSSRKNKRDWNGSCFHENFGNHQELAGKSWCLTHWGPIKKLNGFWNKSSLLFRLIN